MYENRKIWEAHYLSRHRTGDNRNWRQKGSVVNPRMVIEKRLNNQIAKKRAIWSVLVMLVVIVVLLVLLSFLLNNRPEISIFCIPGFVGPTCERSNFLGTFIWSTNDFYTLKDGLQHRKGIAFRFYAPGAKSVTVKAKPESGLENYYPMTLQTSGYWFCNVGSIGIHSEYVYLVETCKGEQVEHLIQGSKQIIQTPHGWRSVEPDDSTLRITLSHTSSDKPIKNHISSRQPENDIMYIMHLPSFSNTSSSHGTYLSTINKLDYLQNLGVTLIRLLSLEPSICNNESSIRSTCWHSSSVVYSGVQHPSYGSQSELCQLIDAIHERDMKVLIDIDWTGFDHHSDYYNVDGSSYPTVYGPFFSDHIHEYTYQGHSSRNVDLASNRPASTLLNDILYRYSWIYKFDGVYWKGLLCLRLNGTDCGKGEGDDYMVNSMYLQRVVERLDTVNKWYGEDDDNIHYVTHNNAGIRNIVNSVNQKGAGFDAKRDLVAMNHLQSIYLSSVIYISEVINYLLKHYPSRNIISIQSLEQISNDRLISRMLPFSNNQLNEAIHRVLQMNALLAFTPGVLAIIQGDEYFESRAMSTDPPTLDHSLIGSIDSDSDLHWSSYGPQYGIYMTIRSLLQLRMKLQLNKQHITTIVHQDDVHDVVVAMIGEGHNQRLVIIHTSDQVIIQPPVQIVIPSSLSERTHWTLEFNTDDEEIHEGFITLADPIVIVRCDGERRIEHEHKQEKRCVNLQMGSFAVKVYRLETSEL